MMTKKTIAAILAAVMLTMMTAGCNSTEQPPASPLPATEPSASHTPETMREMPSESNEDMTFFFTDSAGREVELPANIDRIAPSGSLAQIVLYTISPEKLVGLSNDFAETQLEFMDSAIAQLPVLGSYSQGTMNLESLMVANPQVFIDIGEVQNDSAGDMDGIQEMTGIPAIFIQMDTLESMITAYETLGNLLNVQQQAQSLGGYIASTIRDVVDIAAEIPENERVSVFFAQNDGLTAVVDQTVHSDVIDFVSAVNVAQIEASLRGGAAEISMEQLLLWNPDIILFAPDSIYDEVAARPEWAAVSAVSAGRYYKVPSGLYNWMGRPPSVNRVIGIRWLANLLYPDIFPFDMMQETREFYRLFYHWEITDAQITELLMDSSLK